MRKSAASLLTLALIAGALGGLHGQVPEPAPSVLKAPNTPIMAKPAPQKIDPARLAISPKDIVKVENMGPTEKREIHYTFTNTSDAPISLRTTDMSLGIQVVGPALMAPIPAKGKAELTLTVDATGTVGFQKRAVRLLTDDPKQARYTLPLHVVVRPDLTVDAERKSFKDVGLHESPQSAFTFKRETGEPLNVKVVNTLPDYLEFEVDRETKGQNELRLVLRPSKIAPGTMRGLEMVKVETNAPFQPKFTLYVDWNLKPEVKAEPVRVVFLDPKLPLQSLKLERHDKKPFKIKEAKVVGEGFTVNFEKDKTLTRHHLRVHRVAPKEIRSLLELHFEGSEEVLKVPLNYLPPPESEK